MFELPHVLNKCLHIIGARVLIIQLDIHTEKCYFKCITEISGNIQNV